MAAIRISNPSMDNAKYGGLVREDVMDKIWDISDIPLPFTDMCSKGTHTNRRIEWTEDKLAVPLVTNAVIEGADLDQDDTRSGTRLGNYTQIAVKEVKVTDSSQQSDSIGGAGKLIYQISERQKELRRDVEAQMLTHQGSIAGNADTIAGISAGLGAQLKTNVRVGATGAVGGFNTTSGLFEAPSAGTPAALSETAIRDVLQSIYEQGGNTKVLMARPSVIRKLSEYMFTDTARVATLTATTPNPTTGNGGLKAYGSVNVFITDFGQTVEMRDNRLQQQDYAGASSMYFLDPSHLKQSIFRGYQVESLAKTGLSEKRMMSVQYSLLVLNERSQGAIFDIDEAAAVVA